MDRQIPGLFIQEKTKTTHPSFTVGVILASEIQRKIKFVHGMILLIFSISTIRLWIELPEETILICQKKHSRFLSDRILTKLGLLQKQKPFLQEPETYTLIR